MSGASGLEAGAQNYAPEPELSGMACAVFAAMLKRPLRRRISSASGIHPDNAAELLAAFAELNRIGGEWMASRPISVASRPLTEINTGSVADMEIDTEKAAELLNLTTSRIRQLLRSGELQGRKVGRRWVIKRSDVLGYRAPREVAA
jgi:excisionase family DNA binding protein